VVGWERFVSNTKWRNLPHFPFFLFIAYASTMFYNLEYYSDLENLPRFISTCALSTSEAGVRQKGGGVHFLRVGFCFVAKKRLYERAC